MLTLTNLTNYKIDKDLIARAADESNKTAKGKKLKEISLVFVSEAKIKQINRLYRHKNTPTDVLSFAGLNEIFVCPSVVQKQAKNSKNPFGGELMGVVIHGILHLKGFDHEKSRPEADIMREAEQKILQKINGREKK